MNCKACDYPETRVIYTRPFDHERQIKRRRECIKCGERFTTHEKLRDDKNRREIV